jgi:hypothetical protein
MTERSRFFDFSDSEEEGGSSSSNAMDAAVAAAAAPIAALNMVIVIDSSSSDDDEGSADESADVDRNASDLFGDTDDEEADATNGINEETNSPEGPGGWSNASDAMGVAMDNSDSQGSSNGIEPMQGQMHLSMSCASDDINGGFSHDSSTSRADSANDSADDHSASECYSDPSWDDDNLDETYVPDQDVEQDSEGSDGIEELGATQVLLVRKRKGKSKNGKVAIDNRGNDTEIEVAEATPEECESMVGFCCFQCCCPKHYGWFTSEDLGLYHRLCCHNLTPKTLRTDNCTPIEACSHELEIVLTSGGSIKQDATVVHRKKLMALSAAAERKAKESRSKCTGFAHVTSIVFLTSLSFSFILHFCHRK